ncbi:MAG: purine-nucleoside phosphorylase [Chitinophagales bacterium]|nr:purine-nucleoside phosphorylase [Chitinophagales bacterium]
MIDKIKETVAYIESQTDFKPQFGIILGTGLGNLAQEIEVVKTLDYASIPNFPVSTVESHKGRLIFGYLGEKKVVAMQGRFHYYEGYNMQEVTFPVRVFKFLGIGLLLISNASGGLNPSYKNGDLMILRDHINMQPEHPLRGKNYAELGPRFPDMLKTYDKALVQQGLDIARKHNIDCHAGVYVGVQGPTLETPAEYKFFHIIGGDAVGMSTVPEAIVAKHMELKVFAISVITDMGYPEENIKETSLQNVIDVASTAEPKLTLVMRELINSL